MLFKADGEEEMSNHILKHIGEVINFTVKPYQWWNIFNWHCGWYCKKCKKFLKDSK